MPTITPVIIFDQLATDFRTMADAVLADDQPKAVGAQAHMVDLANRLLDFYPHTKDTVRSFPTFNRTPVPNFFANVFDAQGDPPNRTGMAVAEFVSSLLLEREWQELAKENVIAEAAIGRAQYMQKEALTLVILTTGRWCHGLVEKLIERPMAFMEIGQ